MAGKSLAKNSVFNVIYYIASFGFQFITSIYVARILQETAIGKVSYADNIASYFVTLATLGLPTYGMREIAKAQEDSLNTNKVFTELFIINALFSTIAAVGYLLLIFHVDSFAAELPLFLCCGVPVFINYFNIDWFYQGKEEYAYIVKRSILIKIFFLAALLLLVQTKDDYVLYALITVLASSGNYIFNIIHARKYVRFDFTHLDIGGHMKPLFVFALNVFFVNAYNKFDITMLGSMAGNDVTGYYTYAHKTVFMAITACIAATTVFLPRLSYYYKHDKDEFRKLLDLGGRGISFFVIPASVGLFLLAPQIIVVLYGSSFFPCIATVRIFSVLLIIRGFGDLYCYQLMICSGNEKKRLLPNVIATMVNIFLNDLLIPCFEHNGAAIASVITELIVNVFMFMLTKRAIGFKVNIKAIAQAVSGSMIMAVVVYIITISSMYSWIKIISGVILGIAVYVMVNVLMKNQFTTEAALMLKTRLKKF